MNANDLATFNQAVALAKGGYKEVAYSQLKALLNRYSREPNLLLWVAFTSPTLEESEAAIRTAASLEPQSSTVASARQWLEKQQNKQRQLTAGVGSTPTPRTQAAIYASQNQPQSIESYAADSGSSPIAVEGDYTRGMKNIRANFKTVDPQTVVETEKKARPKSFRFIMLGGIIAVLLLAIIAFSFINSRTNVASGPVDNSPYKLYTDPQLLKQEAKNGDLVRFTGTLQLAYKYADKGDYYNWVKSVYETSRPVIVKFPVGSKLKPAEGTATYYVKVVGRSDDNVYIYTTIDDIKSE